MKTVREAVDRWFDVLNAMLNGDPGPLAELYSQAPDVTYMGAEGTYRVGWDATFADWKAQAAKSGGGRAEGRDIRIIEHGDMATAAHYTQGQVTQQNGKTVDVRLRETSVFRKEDGAWRMIAHHADLIPFWAEALDT